MKLSSRRSFSALGFVVAREAYFKALDCLEHLREVKATAFEIEKAKELEAEAWRQVLLVMPGVFCR